MVNTQVPRAGSLGISGSFPSGVEHCAPFWAKGKVYRGKLGGHRARGAAATRAKGRGGRGQGRPRGRVADGSQRNPKQHRQEATRVEEPGGFALGAGVSAKGRCSSERGPRRTSPRPARGEARRPRPSHSRPARGGERRGQAHGTRLPVRAAEGGWGRGAGAADPLPRRPRGVHEPAGLLLRWDPPWVSHQEQPGSRGSTRPRSRVGRGRTARPGRGAAQTGRPGRAPRTVNRPRPPRGLGLRELHSARGSPGGVGTCDARE